MYHDGKFETVIDNIKPLLIAQPKSVIFLNILGSSFSALKLFDRAIEAYEVALDCVVMPGEHIVVSIISVYPHCY